MEARENVPLSDHTTLRIGGPAALLITIERPEELPKAYELARKRELPVYPLGAGSNILASDGPIKRAMLHITATNVTYVDDGDVVRVTADAGKDWDELVSETTSRGLWGLENLAGIPGTVGAAPVQNIGAYGREVMDVIARVEAYDPAHDSFITYANEECGFTYRDSRFKREPGQVITRVTFTLSRTPRPNLSYADVARRLAEGAVLDTPMAIAREMRDIRAQKFPDLSVHGTAGSFFKNPTISSDAFAALHEKYPELSGFETEKGIKIPIAWIMDHVLFLRGHTIGPVRMFERHALVVVADPGATAHDVEVLANDVAKRIYDATKINVEREVQSLQ